MNLIAKINTGREWIMLPSLSEQSMRRIGRRAVLAALSVASVTVVSHPARAFDMDCKVILCLAGGFPSGCSDAKTYMLRRLKKLKPPFGPCSSGDDDGGTYDVPVRMFTRKIQPICTAWMTDRDGRHCRSWISGREEGVIGITISQGEGVPDFSNQIIWWSRPWNPSENEK